MNRFLIVYLFVSYVSQDTIQELLVSYSLEEFVKSVDSGPNTLLMIFQGVYPITSVFTNFPGDSCFIDVCVPQFWTLALPNGSYYHSQF